MVPSAKPLLRFGFGARQEDRLPDRDRSTSRSFPTRMGNVRCRWHRHFPHFFPFPRRVPSQGKEACILVAAIPNQVGAYSAASRRSIVMKQALLAVVVAPLAMATGACQQPTAPQLNQ